MFQEKNKTITTKDSSLLIFWETNPKVGSPKGYYAALLSFEDPRLLLTLLSTI